MTFHGNQFQPNLGRPHHPAPHTSIDAELEHLLTQLQSYPHSQTQTRHPFPSSQSLHAQPHLNHPPISSSKKPPSTDPPDASSTPSRPTPKRIPPLSSSNSSRPSGIPSAPAPTAWSNSPATPQSLRHPRWRFQQSPQRHQLEPHRQPLRLRRPLLALHTCQQRAPDRQRPRTGPPRSAAAHRPPSPRPLRGVRHRRPLPQARQRSPLAPAPLAWDNGNLPTLDMHHQLRATGTTSA